VSYVVILIIMAVAANTMADDRARTAAGVRDDEGASFSRRGGGMIMAEALLLALIGAGLVCC